MSHNFDSPQKFICQFWFQQTAIYQKQKQFTPGECFSSLIHCCSQLQPQGSMKTPNIRNIRQRIFLRSQRITGIVLLQLLATCKNTAMTIAHINCLETVFLNDFCWNFLHNAFLRLTCLMNSLQILVFQLDWRGKNHAWKTNSKECQKHRSRS